MLACYAKPAAVATLEHLKIILRGVHAWNSWREADETVIPHLICAQMPAAQLMRIDLVHAEIPRANFTESNLAGANLSGAVGVGADFTRADLSGATLVNASLTGATFTRAHLGLANLSGASLAHANFAGADLTHANLIGARLRGANLTHANLTGADLTGADLMHADLGEANLNLATMAQTIRAEVQLNRVRGLGTCCHLGPSVVDHWTLARSGMLPVQFLRGCGLSDELIARWIPELPHREEPALVRRTQAYTCFIRHSNADEAFARRLHDELQNQDIRCWLSNLELNPGTRFRSAVGESLGPGDVIVLVLSSRSLQIRSLEKQVAAALEIERSRQRRVLFPIALDQAVIDHRKGFLLALAQTREIVDCHHHQNPAACAPALARLISGLCSAVVQNLS